MLHYWRIERLVVLFRTPAVRALLVRLPISSALLAAYWLALFVATHTPVRVARGAKLPWDKLVHFGSYGVLALMLAWTVHGRSQLTRLSALLLFGVIALYGAVDELTQRLVPSRSADFADWVADCAGGAIGLTAFALIMWLLPPRRTKTART